MTRKISEVWVVNIEWLTKTPLHIGGWGSEHVDLDLVRDGNEQPYIPGTSMLGVIRARLREIDKHIEDHLFGRTTENTKRQGAEGYASTVYVEDIEVATVNTEFRDGVAIDRARGAAMDSALYCTEVIPAGIKLPMRIVFEIPDWSKLFGESEEKDMDPPVEATIKRLVSSLHIEGLRIGRSSSRGLGSLVSTRPPTVHRLNLSNIEHIRYWWQLRSQTTATLPTNLQVALNLTDAEPAQIEADARKWRFIIHWRPVGPTLVKSSANTDYARILPLSNRISGQHYPVVPGASVKGVLRTLAERVVRSICGFDGRLPTKPDQQILESDRYFEGVVNNLFGRPAQKSQSRPARSAVFVKDCFHTMGLQHHPVKQDPSNIDGSHYRRRTMVSIDRWSGGALDSALFSVLESPWEARTDQRSLWEPIEIELNPSLLTEKKDRFAVYALWFLVLRDFAEGRIPLGYGTRRGFGQIEVQKIQVAQNNRPPTVLDPLAPNHEWNSVLMLWQEQWSDLITNFEKEAVA